MFDIFYFLFRYIYIVYSDATALFTCSEAMFNTASACSHSQGPRPLGNRFQGVSVENNPGDISDQSGYEKKKEHVRTPYVTS